jgi:hypothetical protein
MINPAPASEDAAPSKKASDAVFKEADKRWRYINDTDYENRKRAKDDIEFVWVKGKQWPDRIRLEREADNRPWLEINQLPQFIKQVVNDQRQNRPAIKIRPEGEGANKEVAEVIEGLTRAIEYKSQAAAVYDSGFESAVTGGRGYWRVCTEYERDDSFDQVVTIKRIPDPMAVYMDPDYQAPDASDIEYCFVAEVMTREKFEREWPDAQPLDFEGMDTRTLESKWVEGADEVVVADYFRKVYDMRTLCAMSDGSAVWEDLLGDPDERPEGAPEDYDDSYGGLRVVDRRESRDVSVEWYKVYGGGVLTQYEWPGKFIPVVMCVGDEIMVQGSRTFQGLIRRARDVQTMFNFWQTKATEQIALAPNAQWLAPEGATEGYEYVWNNSNIRNFMVLPYKVLPNGVAPQRIEPAQAQSGMLEQANQCRQDFYTTIGIYPPNLGKDSQEVSGIAINYRQQQGDRATFHFVDNLSRAIELTGRIVVDLIPHIYDTQRMLSVLDDDGTQKTVTVNQADPLSGQVVNDLRKGNYAVAVDVGPSYATKRMAAAQSMFEFMQAYPPAAPMIGDLVARNQDWPDADDIAARLQVMLPPSIQMLEAQKDKDPRTAALASAMQQMQQQMQGMQAQAGQQMQVLQGHIAQLTTENQKLQVAAAQAKLQGVNTAMSYQAKMADVQEDAQTAKLKVAAEQQRTGIEAYSADSDRLGVVLDFVAKIMALQQTQAQNVGQEAEQLAPAVESASKSFDQV